MKRSTLSTAVVVLGAVIAIPVLAGGDHGIDDRRNGPATPAAYQMGSGAMMGGDMAGMMQMMQMMQGAQNGMMGLGSTGFGMMGAGPMGFGDRDAIGVDTQLETYDADGNGTLSLDEFETLTASRARDLAADRFQAFDADGDGEVSIDEFAAPAARFEQMGRLGTSTLLQQPGTVPDDAIPGEMDNN